MIPEGLLVDCPTCRKPTPYNDKNEFRPFCSRGCKGDDLVAWADGKYAVPAQNVTEDDLREVENSMNEELDPED